MFYLPSYSPELNPEERLNADLKQPHYTKVPVRTKEKLKAATTEHMQNLEKSPERVKKFLQNPRVKYAVEQIENMTTDKLHATKANISTAHKTDQPFSLTTIYLSATIAAS